MKKLKAYISDTYSELALKVSWPTWKELQSSAVIVMVATLITALVVFIMDAAFNKIMDLVYSFFS